MLYSGPLRRHYVTFYFNFNPPEWSGASLGSLALCCVSLTHSLVVVTNVLKFVTSRRQSTIYNAVTQVCLSLTFLWVFARVCAHGQRVPTRRNLRRKKPTFSFSHSDKCKLLPLPVKTGLKRINRFIHELWGYEKTEWQTAPNWHKGEKKGEVKILVLLFQAARGLTAHFSTTKAHLNH